MRKDGPGWGDGRGGGAGSLTVRETSRGRLAPPTQSRRLGPTYCLLLK
jgi:hypothetical protein